MSDSSINSDTIYLNLDKIQAQIDLSTTAISTLNSGIQLATTLDNNYTTSMSALNAFSFLSGILNIKKDLKSISDKIKINYLPAVATSITKLARDLLSVTNNACCILLGINTIYLSSTNKTPSTLWNQISQGLTNIGTITGIVSSSLLIAQSFTMIAKSTHLYMKLGSFSNMQSFSEILNITEKSTDEELEKISEYLNFLSGVSLSIKQLKELNSNIDIFDQIKNGLKTQIKNQIYSFILGSITLILATINNLTSNIIGVALQSISLLITSINLWKGTKDIKEQSNKEAKHDSIIHKLILITINSVIIGSLVSATVLSGGTAPCAILLIAVASSLLMNSFLYFMTRNVAKEENLQMALT